MQLTEIIHRKVKENFISTTIESSKEVIIKNTCSNGFLTVLSSDNISGFIWRYFLVYYVSKPTTILEAYQVLMLSEEKTKLKLWLGPRFT